MDSANSPNLINSDNFIWKSTPVFACKIVNFLYINRLSCLALCFDLIKKCAALYESLPSFHEIMHPIRILLTQHVPVNEYPEKMQVCIPQDLNNQCLCFINKFCDLPLCINKKKKSVSINFFKGHAFWAFWWSHGKKQRTGNIYKRYFSIVYGVLPI